MSTVSINLILYPTYNRRMILVFCCVSRMRPDAESDCASWFSRCPWLRSAVCRVGSVPHDFLMIFYFQGFLQVLWVSVLVLFQWIWSFIQLTRGELCSCFADAPGWGPMCAESVLCLLICHSFVQVVWANSWFQSLSYFFPLSAESVLCLIIFQVSCKSYERNCVVSMNLILYPTYKGRIMFVFCCRPRMRPDVCRVGSMPHDFQGFFQFLWA